jgi:hypothetical protein
MSAFTTTAYSQRLIEIAGVISHDNICPLIGPSRIRAKRDLCVSRFEQCQRFLEIADDDAGFEDAVNV